MVLLLVVAAVTAAIIVTDDLSRKDNTIYLSTVKSNVFHRWAVPLQPTVSSASGTVTWLECCVFSRCI